MPDECKLTQVEYPQFIHDFVVQVYEHNKDPFEAAKIDYLPVEYLRSPNVRKFKAAVIFLCLLYREVMQPRMEGK